MGAHPELRFGQGFVIPIRRSMEKSSCKQLARQIVFREVWAEKDVCTQTFVPRFPQPCGSSFKGAQSPGASPVVAFLQDNEQVAAGGWTQVHQPPSKIRSDPDFLESPSGPQPSLFPTGTRLSRATFFLK